MNKKESKKTEETAPETAPVEKPMDKEISDLFGPWLEKNKINEAIAIVKKPDGESYCIFYRGHFYDAARLLAQVLRNFKEEISRDLAE